MIDAFCGEPNPAGGPILLHRLANVEASRIHPQELLKVEKEFAGLRRGLEIQGRHRAIAFRQYLHHPAISLVAVIPGFDIYRLMELLRTQKTQCGRVFRDCPGEFQRRCETSKLLRPRKRAVFPHPLQINASGFEIGHIRPIYGALQDGRQPNWTQKHIAEGCRASRLGRPRRRLKEQLRLSRGGGTLRGRHHLFQTYPVILGGRAIRAEVPDLIALRVK